MPTLEKSKLSRLTLRGKKVDEGSFAVMTSLKKQMVFKGFPEDKMHVGYACAKGVFYCKGCGAQVTDPYNDWYQGHEFWRCECKQINYIN